MRCFQQKIGQNSIVGFLLVSIGVLLTASAGGWDVTNHLLNKPESFFSPPHAALYTGVSVVIAGALIIYNYQVDLRNRESRNEFYRKSRTAAKVRILDFNLKYLPCLPLSVKLIFVGVTLLIAAGPIDFFWHLTFGLDGLLSPPHSILTIGMVLCSIGSFLGLIPVSSQLIQNRERTTKETNFNKTLENRTDDSVSLKNSKKGGNYSSRILRRTLHPVLLVVGILPVWLTLSGLIHMVSLPFSDTQFFNFNPDPVLAAIVSTICFPFLIALILFSSFKLANDHIENLNRGLGSKSWKESKVTVFGTLSLTGLAFIIVNIATSIIPNEHLIVTLPFYVLNILPIIAADLLLTKISSINNRHNSDNRRENWMKYLAGAIFGLMFFTIYFPLITHTYNEVLPRSQPVWPSLTTIIYFKMINEISLVLIPLGMIMGVLGVVVSSMIFRLKEERQLITSNPVN
jgi:hypothetical protein